MQCILYFVVSITSVYSKISKIAMHNSILVRIAHPMTASWSVQMVICFICPARAALPSLKRRPVPGPKRGLYFI